MTITSTSNQEIKRIRGLHGRKDREQTGLYLVEGTRLVGMAIEWDAGIEKIVYCRPLLKGHGERILEEAQARGIPCIEVAEEVLTSISEDHAYQGIVAVVRQRWRSLEDIAPSDELCWLAVNAVQHPGNLGIMLRASDAAGGAGIILIGDAADPHYPSAVRSSLGAIFTQGIVRAGLEDFAAWTRKHGYTVVGASPHGSVDYRHVAYQPRIVLFMGNERAGLTEEQQALCDILVRIPMVGHVDSHNVAVAASIMLYEMLDQRQRRYRDGDQVHSYNG